MSDSLFPQHSTDLASDLSAHLSSALASDKSYSQMNDAKLRGMSSAVGWDQFHGMVLTAHLQPVDLRKDPIDEIGKGIARHKKMEQLKTRSATSYTVDQLLADHQANSTAAAAAAASASDAASAASSDSGVAATPSVAVPTNAHEFARDWKKFASIKNEDAAFMQQQRYKYLQAIPVSSLNFLLKGGIPLEMIGSIIECIHAQWIQPAATTEASTDSPPTTQSPPSPSEVSHSSALLQALSAMSSFTISVFSLKKEDKLRVKELLDHMSQVSESDEFKKWLSEQQAQSASSTSTAATAAANNSVAAPAAPNASSASGSASYPMLLPGWPVEVGQSSSLVTSSAARDESSSASHMTVSSNVPLAAINKNNIVALTGQLVEQLRVKFKVDKL